VLKLLLFWVMAVWRTLSAFRGNAQAQTEAQMRNIPDEAACKAGGALVPELDISKNLAVRSPEQTALIALRGLLDAKEMYIQKLEVRVIPLISKSLAGCCLRQLLSSMWPRPATQDVDMCLIAAMLV